MERFPVPYNKAAAADTATRGRAACDALCATAARSGRPTVAPAQILAPRGRCGAVTFAAGPSASDAVAAVLDAAPPPAPQATSGGEAAAELLGEQSLEDSRHARPADTRRCLGDPEEAVEHAGL